MARLDKAVSKILKMRQMGLGTEAITAQLNITPSEVSCIEDKVRERIRLATSLQITDNNEFAMQVGVSRNTLRRFCHYNVSTTTDGVAAAIRQAIKEGVKSDAEIAGKVGIALSSVRLIARLKKISLKGLRHSYSTIKRKPGLDALVEQGLTLEAMGTSVNPNLTRERVRQYLEKTGQHGVWEDAKKQRTDSSKAMTFVLNRHLSALVSVLYASLMAQLPSQPWHVQKTVEYLMSSKGKHPNKYAPETLLYVYRKYEAAIARGERASLAQLAEGSGLYGSNVGRLLNRIGIEPMHGKVKRATAKQIVKREVAFSLKMPTVDIAYFLGTPAGTLKIWFSRRGGRPLLFKRLPRGMRTAGLTYAIASQVYEARDAGFSRDEIVEVIGCKGNVVDFTLQHRPVIEPVIVNALKKLYPEDDVRKPYHNVKR